MHYDEEEIAAQMKEREENPKMKIDEPDTPYRYADPDDDTDPEEPEPSKGMMNSACWWQ